MKSTNILFLLFFLSLSHFSKAQFPFTKYFEGSNDSLLKVKIDTSKENIWQIGKPQKTIFYSAATLPNAIITDTLKSYPTKNKSSFTLTIDSSFNYYGVSNVIAVRWKQKLDFDSLHKDGGIIEFSKDFGKTWNNVFNNPYVYNFYGFDSLNFDTIQSGDLGFSGRDTLWKDIWLCFDSYWMYTGNSNFQIRYTFKSDSINENRDGWIMDNFMIHITMHHTVKTINNKITSLTVYPQPAKEIAHIEVERTKETLIITKMTLQNIEGKIVDSWENIPTKFFIDTKKYSNGIYQLNVTTNVKSESVRLLINHE